MSEERLERDVLLQGKVICGTFKSFGEQLYLNVLSSVKNNCRKSIFTCMIMDEVKLKITLQLPNNTLVSMFSFCHSSWDQYELILKKGIRTKNILYIMLILRPFYIYLLLFNSFTICHQTIEYMSTLHTSFTLQAQQASELETLLPLQYGPSKLIMAGDLEQLAPKIKSKVFRSTYM